MLKGFRDFIARGNVIDLSVAFVAGAAFTALVTTFTESLINPLVGLTLGGGVDVGAVTVNGQVFDFSGVINGIITFIITMLVLYFVFVLPMNKYRQRHAQDEVDTRPADIQLLTEIRDLLSEQKRG
ncbi:MAG: hypothetical protein RJB01_317 [Actinomycetota bacterium]|jgi:large conductance mechanosensitive channel